MKSKKFTQIISQQSEILTFGKYKYCTVQHILRVEPSYILWLDEKEIVQFPVEIITLAEDKLADMSYVHMDNDDDLRGMND